MTSCVRQHCVTAVLCVCVLCVVCLCLCMLGPGSQGEGTSWSVCDVFSPNRVCVSAAEHGLCPHVWHTWCRRQRRSHAHHDQFPWGRGTSSASKSSCRQTRNTQPRWTGTSCLDGPNGPVPSCCKGLGDLLAADQPGFGSVSSRPARVWIC